MVSRGKALKLYISKTTGHHGLRYSCSIPLPSSSIRQNSLPLTNPTSRSGKYSNQRAQPKPRDIKALKLARNGNLQRRNSQDAESAAVRHSLGPLWSHITTFSGSSNYRLDSTAAMASSISTPSRCPRPRPMSSLSKWHVRRSATPT